MRRSLICVTAAAALCAAAPKGYTVVEHKAARLSMAAPAGWKIERGAHGLAAVGKAAAGKTAPRASVDYYAPGNAMFKDVDAYIAGKTKDPVGEVAKVIGRGLNGRKAQTFTHKRQTESVVLREEHWIVPLKNGGFHAIILSAADADFANHRKTFDKILASLKLN